MTLAIDARQADGRSWVALAVRDTGPGIAPDEQERVFDRFFRGRVADSGHIPGTGLGLSMAQAIVRALEVLNMIEIAVLIFLTARERKETRGKHIRPDYPFTNPLLEKLLVVRRDDAEPRLEWRKIKR